MTSNSHHTPDHEAPHEGPIKTPRQLIWAVLFAFIVPIAGIVLLVTYVGAGKKPGAGSDFMAAEAVARRIQPVGTVTIREANAGGAGVLKTGEQVFQAQCSACHGTGAAGSPKFGDEAAWAPRIKSGYEALLSSALKGKNAMPPQGGGALSEVEVGRAVVYMANKAGAKFPEPKAPAGDTAAAPAAAAPAATATAAAPAAAPAAAQGDAAPALFTQTCQACHAAGVAGAPKVGDKAAWAPRAAQGIDALTASAIKGKGAMPPKGGSAASDADIKAVVTYMVNASK
ncbi:c-type cytochrome [Azohydromonas lata]|uniref:C-type cytochrome n=1 Tax=Azohydromonas lata TaxID=45677 RepID=A0ABU5IH48_9BURK|nr:c-type cytochrome [Azohydromonas lata]MDZ5458109.1 c-type cytochrome [Azohydromonas lata]